MSDDPHSSDGLVAAFSAQRFVDGRLVDEAIPVAQEVPYTLFVNDREILSIATLPSNLEELFVGFLVSEGVLTEPTEVGDCHVDHANKLVMIETNVPGERLEKLDRKGMLTSGCAGGMVFSVQTSAAGVQKRRGPMIVPCRVILQRMHDLNTFKGIYRTTKGVHGAAAATRDETLIILEDLGRHNAVDKIVGHCFLHRLNPADKILLTTGRITSEVLSKAARSGFPLIVSRSSASAMALRIAEQCSIDVVTYVKAKRFNYFSAGGVELVEE